MTDGQTDGIAIAYTRYSIYAVARKNMTTVAECDTQATVAGLLMTALGDSDGRGLVASTVDQPRLPVDHTQRPPLCTARWASERDKSSRGSVGVS